jgi:hypothetical protein
LIVFENEVKLSSWTIFPPSCWKRTLKAALMSRK